MKSFITVSQRSPGWLPLCLMLAGGAGCVAEDPAGPGPIDNPPPIDNPTPGTGKRMKAASGGIATTQLRGTADGGNADGIHGCDVAQGSYSHYEHSAGDGTQLHVVGIYAAAQTPFDAPPTAHPAEVRVTRPGSSVLVLSAYEATKWNVIVDEGATVERIIVSGYEAQSVTAPDGIPIEMHTYEEGGGYLGSGTAYQWPSWYATDLVDAAEELTGLELTSFRGCSTSNRFQIDEPGALRPPREVSDKSEPTPIPGCESLSNESSCVALNSHGSALAMVDLDSGATCQGPALKYLESSSTWSLGWHGDYVYACLFDRGLARISVLDGSVDVAPVSCDSVTTQDDGGLVALTRMPLEGQNFQAWHLVRFASFEAAAQRQIDRVFELDPWATRIAVHGNRIYFAWHSTNTVETAELADDAEIKGISLEGYDNWIYAMDVTDDGRLLIGGPDGLHVFDATTGASLDTIGPELSNSDLAGMKCVSNEAP